MMRFNLRKSMMLKLILVAALDMLRAFLAFAQVENIDNQKLKFLIAEGIPIIDIREEVEWKDTGIVDKSHLITFFDSEGKYDVKKWLDELEEITSRNDPVIIICRSGRRSQLLANYLSKYEKFLKVYNVTEGIKGWKKANFKTQVIE